MSEDIRQSHFLPLRQQLHWCPGSPIRHMGQEHVFSAEYMFGTIAILDSIKLPRKRNDTSFAVNLSAILIKNIVTTPWYTYQNG